MNNDSTFGPRLLIDPRIEPAEFDFGLVKAQFEQETIKDNATLEALLREINFLNRQLTIWSYARISQIDQSHFDSILTSGQAIAENEQAQSHSRGVVLNFLQSLKSAFQALAPE